MRRSLLAAAGLGSVVIALSGCGVVGGTTANAANPGSAYGANAQSTARVPAAAPMQTGTILSIRQTKIGYVLTNSRGLTLYWYSADHPGKSSACTSSCLTAWPAVTGKPVVASLPGGIKLAGRIGWITRPGGIIQATYNGYPLYTYHEDTAPGQTNGNNEGGVWHVITGKVLTTMKLTGSGSGSSGAGAAASPSPAATATAASGGGYGY